MRVVPVALVVALSCLAAWAQPVEMVANGSFETLGDSGLPEGWRVSPEGAASVESGDAPGGERWLHMVKPEGASHTLAFQRLSVKPNTGYRLRAYLRAPKPSYYSLIAYNAVMNTLASKPTGWAVLGEWVELALDFRTGETDTAMSVGLLAFGAEAEWDGVRLWEDDSVRIGDLTPTVNDTPGARPNDRAKGYMVFGRRHEDFVSPAFVPSSNEGPWWAGTCPRGQYETVVVGIHALEDLSGVSATLEPPHPNYPDIFPADLLQVESSRRAINSQAWERYPLLLVPPHSVDLKAGETLQYALRAHVPEDYEDVPSFRTIRLEIDGKPVENVAVSLDIPGVTLDPADIAFFMYYSDSYLPEEMATGAMQAAYCRDMAAHGMNSVSLYVVPEREADGGYSIDLHHDGRYPASDPRHFLGMAERIAQMRAAGLAGRERPLVLISGGRGLYDWGAFRDPGSVRELMRLGGLLDWPPLLFYMHDEPNLPDRVEAVRRTHERVYAGIPEARTVTAIADYGIEQVGGLYDVWITALSDINEELAERARREGKELWAYDCRQRGQRPEFDRFVCGVWAWASGVKGVGQWAYYSKTALERSEDGGWDVPQDFDGWYMMPSEAGPIATVGWEARREGIEDYRALRTLERLVAEHGITRDTPAWEGGDALHVLERARAFAPIDAFAGAPRDWRYVWEFKPWRQESHGNRHVSPWEEMGEIRSAAYDQIELIQALPR